MRNTNPNSVEKRIREIAAEISSITEFAEGSIASSRKQYALKDGTVRRASPQFRFQTKGGRGKQVCKYVPPCAVARVKELADRTNAPCVEKGARTGTRRTRGSCGS